MRWWVSALWLLGCVAVASAGEAKPHRSHGRATKVSKPAHAKKPLRHNTRRVTKAVRPRTQAAANHAARTPGARTPIAPSTAPTPAPTPAPSAEPALAPATSGVASSDLDRASAPATSNALPVGVIGDAASPDRVSEPPDAALKRVTITTNPLALIIGRYGANLEIMIAPHHAIVGSGFVQTFSTPLLRTLAQGGTWDDSTRPLFGGELGYRIYSGRTGATGLFAGASFVTMPIAYPRLGAALRPEIVSYHAQGGAIDVGVSAIVRGGITLGGGLGVMALAYPRPDNTSLPAEIAAVAPPLPTLPAPRVLPRLLFTAGYSF